MGKFFILFSAHNLTSFSKTIIYPFRHKVIRFGHLPVAILYAMQPGNDNEKRSGRE